MRRVAIRGDAPEAVQAAVDRFLNPDTTSGNLIANRDVAKDPKQQAKKPTYDPAKMGVEVRNGNGKLVYALPGAADLRRIEDLATALRRWATGMTPAGQLLVITTRNGLAAPLADAIDEAGLADVAGTVAGENTIFVAARDGMSGTDLEEQFHHHAGGEG